MGAQAHAQTPKSYEEMKKSVAVQRFAGGHVLASSAPFAVVDRQTRYMNGGTGSESVSAMIEARPDDPVEIWFMASVVFALLPTEVQGRDKPANPETRFEAHIGPPWTETTASLLENSVACTGEEQWCRWTRHYRIDVSQELVREIVADEDRKKISMGIGGPNSRWTLPRDHLIATLDAIGLLHAFTSARRTSAKQAAD
jgi:hypothetical protein